MGCQLVAETGSGGASPCDVRVVALASCDVASTEGGTPRHFQERRVWVHPCPSLVSRDHRAPLCCGLAVAAAFPEAPPHTDVTTPKCLRGHWGHQPYLWSHAKRAHSLLPPLLGSGGRLRSSVRRSDAVATLGRVAHVDLPRAGRRSPGVSGSSGRGFLRFHGAGCADDSRGCRHCILREGNFRARSTTPRRKK